MDKSTGEAFIEAPFHDIQGMDRYACFVTACLDYLDGETAEIPSLEGLTPEERARGKSWLRRLGQSRDDYDLLMGFAAFEKRDRNPVSD